LLNDAKALGAKLDAVSRAILTGLYYVLPNLENFNIKGRVIYQLDVGGTELALALAYGVLYTAMLLLLAGVIFQRRDFR